MANERKIGRTVRRAVLKVRIGLRRRRRQAAQRETRRLALRRNKALKDAEVAVAQAAEIEEERQAQVKASEARAGVKQAESKAKKERREQGRETLRSIGRGLHQLGDQITPAKKAKRKARKPKAAKRKKAVTVKRIR